MTKIQKIPRRLQRAANRLVDLLDKAVIEGEKNMHIVVYHKPSTKYANNNFYGDDVRINVRYFHEGVKRETTAYRVLSSTPDYNPKFRIRDVINQIENKGLEVKTIGNRKQYKNKKYCRD